VLDLVEVLLGAVLVGVCRDVGEQAVHGRVAVPAVVADGVALADRLGDPAVQDLVVVRVRAWRVAEVVDQELKVTVVLIGGERRVRLALHRDVDPGGLGLLHDDLHVADVVGVPGDHLEADVQWRAAWRVEHAVAAQLVSGRLEDALGLGRIVVLDLRVRQRRVEHAVVVRGQQGFGIGRR
jgi:hypothetical protein